MTGSPADARQATMMTDMTGQSKWRSAIALLRGRSIADIDIIIADRDRTEATEVNRAPAAARRADR